MQILLGWYFSSFPGQSWFYLFCPIVSIYYQCPRNANILAFKLHLSDSLIPRSGKHPYLIFVSWFLVWKIRSSQPYCTLFSDLEIRELLLLLLEQVHPVQTSSLELHVRWNETCMRIHYSHATLGYLFLRVSIPYGVFTEGEDGTWEVVPWSQSTLLPYSREHWLGGTIWVEWDTILRTRKHDATFSQSIFAFAFYGPWRQNNYSYYLNGQKKMYFSRTAMSVWKSLHLLQYLVLMDFSPH